MGGGAPAQQDQKEMLNVQGNSKQSSLQMQQAKSNSQLEQLMALLKNG